MSQPPGLLSSVSLREVPLRNRIVISPMCMYSADAGMADDFHLAHYARFGLGGAGLVMLEATAVIPDGRISHGDLGIWSDEHIEPLKRIVDLLKRLGAAVGIQLCHAGRKAARQRPWQGNGPIGESDAARGERPWPLTSASAFAMGSGYQLPAEISRSEMERIRDAFVAAARRADAAGFDVVELHAAHGFLLHSFMSPVSNHRTDAYGGDFEGRHRYPCEVIGAVREAWPQDRPLFTRISMEDGADGGRDFSETLAFIARIGALGVDVVDCSSGGIGGHSASTSTGQLPPALGFQIPKVSHIKAQTGALTMAVGLITDPFLADAAIRNGDADLIGIARQALVEPNWPLHAEQTLEAGPQADCFASWPHQYGWWLKRRRPALEKLGADGLARFR